MSRPIQISYWLGFCLLAAIALFFLLSEHRAHALGALPYALLLLCPIVHMFMHRGHGGHGHAGQADHPHGRAGQGEEP